MLADSDYYKISENNELKLIKAAECKMLKLVLANFKLSNNKFLITKDAGDNEIVLYTKGGMLYKPDCLVVNEITLFNKSTNCYDSIPVQIQLNNKSHNVFLSSDGILLNTAKINTECELKQTVEVNSNYSVIRDGLQYYIQNKSNTKRNTKIIELTIDENIEHFELVKNEISFMSSEKELTINEQFGDIQVVSDNEISQITDINSFPAIIANLESAILKKLMTMLGIACVLFLIFVCGLFLAYKKAQMQCCSQNKKRKQKRIEECVRDTDIEMGIIRLI